MTNIRTRLHKLISLQSFVVCTDASIPDTIAYLNARDAVFDKVEADVAALIETAKAVVDRYAPDHFCFVCCHSQPGCVDRIMPESHDSECLIGKLQARIAAFEDIDEEKS